MEYTITVPVSHETALILDGLAHLEGILLATQAQIDALAGRGHPPGVEVAGPEWRRL